MDYESETGVSKPFLLVSPELREILDRNQVSLCPGFIISLTGC